MQPSAVDPCRTFLAGYPASLLDQVRPHLLDGSDVSEAYKDVVGRFLGEDRPLRFAEYEKPGLLARIFGGK